MNIYLKAGHGVTKSRGASAIIDEVVENRKVKNSVLKYLRELGHVVTDVTEDHLDADSELTNGVSRANNGGADLFVSIHFNKAFNHYNGALGTESWVYSKTDGITLDEQVASRINSALVGLGFKNRGVKESADLYELRACKMASIIVEVCFVEATEDVALYKRLGADTIGKAIAYAISNKSIENEVSNAKKVEEKRYDMKNLVCYCNQVDKRGAEYLADYLQCPCIDATLPFSYDGVAENIIAVGGDNPLKGQEGQCGFSGYTTKFITGKDRYETIKEVLKFIGKL